MPTRTKKTKPPKYDLRVVTYYTAGEDEPIDSNFGGDYSWIEVRYPDGTLLVEFGDYYHDKGREKVEGFLAGYAAALARPLDVMHEDKGTYSYTSETGEEAQATKYPVRSI